MAGRVRGILRLAAIVMMTAILVTLRLLVMLLAPFAPRLERRLCRPVAMLWGHLLWPLMGMRVRTVGALPATPFFLVSNHLSYVDAFLLIGLTGGAFVAREDVRRWPGANIVAHAGNTLYIDRSRVRDTQRVGAQILRELERGAGIIVFPEAGTSEGREVRPFKSALLEAAVEARIPVHYCTIHYETRPGEPPASDTVCWHTNIGFMAHALRMLAQRGFTATVTFGESPVSASNRKELAQELYEAARKQFTPVR